MLLAVSALVLRALLADGESHGAGAPERDAPAEAQAAAWEPEDPLAPPIARERVPRAAPEETPPPDGDVLRVTVASQSGERIPGARVEAFGSHGPVATGLTDGDGNYERRLPPPDEFRLVYVRVHADGFASWIWPSAQEPLAFDDGRLELHAFLEPAATVVVTVQDEAGRPLAEHLVLTFWVSPEGATKRPPGIDSSRKLYTDVTGTCVGSDLAPGTWEIHAPQWKDGQPSEHPTVVIEPGATEYVSLTVESEDPSSFASGSIDLPSDAAPSSNGSLTNYKLERTGVRQDWPIYNDGSYYVYAPPGRELILRVVGRGGLTSEWFKTRVGEHDIHWTLRWSEQAGD